MITLNTDMFKDAVGKAIKGAGLNKLIPLTSMIAIKVENNQLTLITTDALDKDNRIKKLEETIDGIKIIRFKNLSNYLAKFHNIYLPLWITKWVKNNVKNYDIVHMHDFFTYLNIITGKYCRKYNIPYVVQPHWSANFLPERWKSWIKKIFFKLFWIVKKRWDYKKML